MSKIRFIYTIMQLGILFLSAFVFCIASGVAWAQEPLKVGEKYTIHIDSGGSSDVKITNTAKGLRYEISHPGATYIAIHFKKFHLAPGDALIVSDTDGGQNYILEDKGKMNAGKFWSQHVKGDTIWLELVSTGQHPDKGFIIDEYAAGFVDLGPGIERICGFNDLENAICRDSSTEYEKARAVARLLIQGSWLCTGWLASANDHLITNAHCIGSSDDATNTDYEFMAEAPTCGSANCLLCWPGTVYSGAEFIKGDSGLDYSLVKFDDMLNPSALYGYLEIDNRKAEIGEQIYLVSHPAGRAKEFAYNSTEDAGEVGRVVSLTEPTCTGGTLEIGYWNDTEGGSSGSPVIAQSSHKVIALHHCHNYCDIGGDPNRGVPIDLIYAEISGLLKCGDGDCAGWDNGEDCNTCPIDCISGSGGSCDACWKGRCDGNCNPRKEGPACADCASGYCCGNGTCEDGENVVNCAVDCGGCSENSDCDDGDSCTTDACIDSSCSNTWPDCGISDGCCGSGCTLDNDPDCTDCTSDGAPCVTHLECCEGSKCLPDKMSGGKICK